MTIYRKIMKHFEKIHEVVRDLRGDDVADVPGLPILERLESDA